MEILETLVKAKQTAFTLVGEIRWAQKQACQDNPVLEILLRDLIGDAVKLQNRLAEIEAAL